MELLASLIILLNNGNNIQYIHKQQSKPVDIRIEKVKAFFDRFNSPFGKYAHIFIEVADNNKLDYRLLPLVACVESSCGKHYKRNAFGWGSDRIDFGNDADDIREIAYKISTLAYYEAYRRSGSIYDFALAYNGPYAEDYYKKLNWFLEKL